MEIDANKIGSCLEKNNTVVAEQYDNFKILRFYNILRHSSKQ
jgi:hypothetical protein